MEEVSPQYPEPAPYERYDWHDERLPEVVVHFMLSPGATHSWRVACDARMNVHDARVWLTRAQSPYDHWLTPGAQLQLTRGERIWMSTDGDGAARVSVRSKLPAVRHPLRRLLCRLLRINTEIVAPVSR